MAWLVTKCCLYTGSIPPFYEGSTHPPTHSLTHPPTHPLTHSLTHPRLISYDSRLSPPTQAGGEFAPPEHDRCTNGALVAFSCTSNSLPSRRTCSPLGDRSPAGPGVESRVIGPYMVIMNSWEIGARQVLLPSSGSAPLSVLPSQGRRDPGRPAQCEGRLRGPGVGLGLGLTVRYSALQCATVRYSWDLLLELLEDLGHLSRPAHMS